MLDHVIVTVSDFTRSIAFYEQALKPLGITDLLDYKGQDGHPDLRGFGTDGRFFFWLKEGRPDPDTVHFGFVAKSHAEVNAFFVAAVAAGGREKTAPVPGTFASGPVSITSATASSNSRGVYELVIQPATNTIYHFLFRSGP